MKEIYLAYANIEPAFLDLEKQKNEAVNTLLRYTRFATKMREHVPGFEPPYIALLRDGALYIPTDPFGFSVAGIVEGGEAIFGNARIRLEEYIRNVTDGRAGLPMGVKTNVIVEFSENELYPQVMKLLAGTHHINRVRIE